MPKSKIITKIIRGIDAMYVKPTLEETMRACERMLWKKRVWNDLNNDCPDCRGSKITDIGGYWKCSECGWSEHGQN